MNTPEYILCIDDDKDDCDLLDEAIQLRRPGYHIRFMKSGEKAVEFLKEVVLNKRLPRLIILDINMPGMNGIQTLIEIQKIIQHSVPILFLTTTPRDAAILFGQENGVSLMAKPVDMDGYKNLTKTIFSSLIPSVS